MEYSHVCNGRTQNAEKVFDSSVCGWKRSQVSFIASLIKCGKPGHARAFYQKIGKDTSIFPNASTFVALLKACTRTKDLETGLRVHADLDAQGLLERNIFVGSALVDFLIKCGLLNHAQQVFNRLPLRNVILWTSLIAGYAELGHGEKALHCFECMKLEGVLPNAVTFTCSLKACSGIGAIEKGQKLHAEIERQGLLERDILLGNTLIDMYVKSGSLVLAQEVFNKLEARNVVSWNVLIAGYADHGYGDESLECFKLMHSAGVIPDAITYIFCLKACGSTGALGLGIDIHAEIERCKLIARNIAIGNALVEMYTSCGVVARSQQVFDKLPTQDVVSWTALISCYTKEGLGERALECLEQMKQKGVTLDAVILLWGLKACSGVKALCKGQEIHAEIERRGFLDGDIMVSSMVVDMYAKCGLLIIAREVFDSIPTKNLVTWNALIGGYVEQDLGDEAMKCFDQMEQTGVSPDPVAFILMLKASGITRALDKGRALHAEIERQGLVHMEFAVGNTLVDMYSQCGDLSIAQEVCDNLQVQTVVSWTALIMGYAEHGRGEEALQCFERMHLDNISPNSVTFVGCLKACGSIGAENKGRQIHMEVERRGLLERDPVVGNTLVDMYARCGSLTIAQGVFDKLPAQDIVARTALMAGYAQLGESEPVFFIFDRMIRDGVRPNSITFLVLLGACSLMGLFGQSQTYYESMSKDFGFAPMLEHHACVVDLLGRMGQLDTAWARVVKIPFVPNHVLWHSVLDACGKCGNVGFGNQAFKQAMFLDKRDPVAFSLMSHLYGGSNS